MLFLDGVYVEHGAGAVRFRWVAAPTGTELTELAQCIAQRVAAGLNAKACCSAMPNTVTWPVSASTRGRWTRFGVTRSPGALPWGRKPVAGHCAAKDAPHG